MENASKALLIAGGVLITMIVASFGVYLYGLFKSDTENLYRMIDDKQKAEFNSQFTKYSEKELTANDVVTIFNLIRENNTTKGEAYKINANFSVNGFNGGNEAEVAKALRDVKVLTIGNDITFFNNETKEYNQICYKFIEKFLNSKFKIKIDSYNQNTGLINKVTFSFKEYNPV